jgi:acylphosphatase
VTDQRRVRVLVFGQVQAVGFRASASDRARSLGIAGWIRNTPDGAVEAELEGPSDRLEPFLAWLRRGPRGARVDRVTVEDRPPAGERRFSVR